ncbi:hypothetical protein RF11_00405 [Thelohanellus kitauei]|uniref:Uncharacterized protein n=1 Tax=Thelohanellus kitauei TaxID=669202 RepID=A0A0C2MC16_THEKT|nr:hypothetical protein RF11_00405 [Thelohanellus kitauei]
MQPSQLTSHFDMHPNYSIKFTKYFRSKADCVTKTRFDVLSPYNNPIIAAIVESYLVSIRITRAMKPHAKAERYCLSNGDRGMFKLKWYLHVHRHSTQESS